MKNENSDLGKVFWTFSIAYLPVQVEVLEVDEKNQKVRTEKGWIESNRLYKTEEDCPQR